MNKKPVVNIGIQRFDKLRKQGAFYIDKTDFIRDRKSTRLNSSNSGEWGWGGWGG